MAPRILGALGKGAGQGKEPKGTVELKSVRCGALARLCKGISGWVLSGSQRAHRERVRACGGGDALVELAVSGPRTQRPAGAAHPRTSRRTQ